MKESALAWPGWQAPPGLGFAGCTAALAMGALLLAGFVPVAFSIATVFLFAGPHNWLEARYFLSRLPARWGKLRSFFLIAFTGIFGLTAAFAALPLLAEWGDWSGQTAYMADALWNTLLLSWIALLIHLRSRQNPRRDWSWTMPVLLALGAPSWLNPSVWSLGLVYLHPLIAFWILDRELGRGRPAWRPAYRCCLAVLPLLLCVLWWHLADTPELPGVDGLTWRITRHAGAEILPEVSNHLLVSTHTFLEMLHYSVWLLVIPLVSLQSGP
jgi:hypothetical protein